MPSFTAQQLGIEDHPEIALFKLAGEADTGSLAAIETMIDSVVSSDTVTLLALDMTDVSYMNSRSVGMIMNYYGILKDRGHSIVLIGVQAGVKETLSLVGVTQLVKTYENFEEFSAAVTG